MTALHATAQLLRNTAAAAEITLDRRRRWAQRLRELFAQRWHTPGSTLTVRISRRPHAGAGGRLLRASVRNGQHACRLRLKWCPQADAAQLRITLENQRWWRQCYPHLSAPVPELLDAWLDDRVLVLEERPGWTVGDEHTPLAVVGRLAAWMRGYAFALPTGDGLASRLGSAVTRGADGALAVRTAELLAVRIEAATRAADALCALGFHQAAQWGRRFDLPAGEALASGTADAGFVHGDFKPGNVLVTERNFAIIDWWIAPCVSWPLTDVASFAGNLWLIGTPSARSIWRAFALGYFPEGVDEVTARRIDLIATAMCLGYLARRARHPACHLLERRRCGQALERLVAADTAIGRPEPAGERPVRAR